MEYIKTFIDMFLHLDAHLVQLADTMGPWLYALVFLIVFCETGLVVTPFLPGDSLLFALGALCALEGSPLHVPQLLERVAPAVVKVNRGELWGTGTIFGDSQHVLTSFALVIRTPKRASSSGSRRRPTRPTLVQRVRRDFRRMRTHVSER